MSIKKAVLIFFIFIMTCMQAATAVIALSFRETQIAWVGFVLTTCACAVLCKLLEDPKGTWKGSL